MEAPIKRNVAKLLMWGAAAWVGYKAISGLANKKSPEKIIKETVEPVEKAAAEVKKVTKKFLKGSPEAKAHMAKLRAKNKTPRGQGKRALKKKAKKVAGKHKGHKTKRGLAQDQKKVSKEEHEKAYQKNKSGNKYIFILQNETSMKGDEIMKVQRKLNKFKSKKYEHFIQILQNETSMKGDEIMKVQRLIKKEN